MAHAPFPTPAHQTGRADFRHPAFRPASPQGTRRDCSGQALEAQNAEFSMNDIECKSAIAAPLHLVSSREKPAHTFKDILVDATVCLAPRAVAKVVGPASQRPVQLFRDHGSASTTCSAFQLNNPRIRTESLRTKVSVAGKRNFQGRDKEAETASKVQGRRCRDKVSLNNPANSGLVAENWEISVSARMRGGGCSRHRTSLLSEFPANREIYREFR